MGTPRELLTEQGNVAWSGRLNTWGYDVNTGQLHFSRNPQGGEIRRGYDERGRMTSLTNENGESYRFVWGENDRLYEEHNLDGTVMRYQYDVCDRVIARTFAADTDSALIHRITCDAAGQTVARETPDGVTRYRYSQTGQLLEAHFTPEGEGEEQVLSLTYDKAGQVVSEQGMTGRVAYQYDALGNRTTVELPEGRALRTLYYGSGHALQVMLDTQVITEFSRDALHRETSRT